MTKQPSIFDYLTAHNEPSSDTMPLILREVAKLHEPSQSSLKSPFMTALEQLASEGQVKS